MRPLRRTKGMAGLAVTSGLVFEVDGGASGVEDN